jgi:hypothetical protein
MMNRYLLILFPFFSAVFGFASSDLPLWGNLQPGPYDVGFTLRSQYDYSRAFRPEVRFDGKRYGGETARPIQILVWYPASAMASAKRLQYRDYVHLGTRELSFEKLTAGENRQSEEQYFRSSDFQSSSRKAFNWLMSATTASVADASEAKGKFPLVLFAAGSGGSAFSNSILCEYLASHGFVVAAIPSIGVYSQEPVLDAAVFEAYTRDMEFTLAAMRTFPNTNARNAAIIAFSMGGSCSSILQMRNMNIRGVIYLDTVGIFNNIVPWDKSALRAPQLYLLRKTLEGDQFARDIKYAEVYTLLWDRDFIRHNDFISDGMLAGVVPGLLPGHAPERKALYEAVCLYTLNFLNGYLKIDPIGLEFMKKTPEQNGIPEKSVHFSWKPAAAPLPHAWDTMDMVEFLQKNGISKLREVYAKNRAASPGLLFAVGNHMWALLDQSSALELFEMSAEMYPSSAMARDILSQAYEMIGNMDKSLLNAKKALELLAADSDLDEQTRNGLKAQLEDRVKRLQK